MENPKEIKLPERKRNFKKEDFPGYISDKEIEEKEREGVIYFAVMHILSAIIFLVAARILVFVINFGLGELVLLSPKFIVSIPTGWSLLLAAAIYIALLFSKDPNGDFKNPQKIKIKDFLDLRCRCSLKERNDYIVEVFGKYCGTWRSGFFIKVPFGFTTNIYEISLQMQSEKLFGSLEEEGDLMELVGGNSVGLSACIFFIVDNSYRAHYMSDYYIDNVIERSEGGIRAFLGGKSFDDANKLRIEYNHDVSSIMGGEEVEISEVLGVNLTDVIIDDFKLRKEEMEARTEVFKADQKVKVAQKNFEAAQHNANSVKVMIEKEGEGVALKIKALVTTGTVSDVNKALEFAAAVEKFNAIKANKGVTILDLNSNPSSNLVREGASLAAGMQAVTNAKATTAQIPDNQDDNSENS